jgi:hypothetical protein
MEKAPSASTSTGDGPTQSAMSADLVDPEGPSKVRVWPRRLVECLAWHCQQDTASSGGRLSGSLHSMGPRYSMSSKRVVVGDVGHTLA